MILAKCLLSVMHLLLFNFSEFYPTQPFTEQMLPQSGQRGQGADPMISNVYGRTPLHEIDLDSKIFPHDLQVCHSGKNNNPCIP